MSKKTVPGDALLPGNTPLWRYMKLSTFFMLLEGKAFFPSVATLQRADPLEGDLVPDPESLMSRLDSVCKKKAKELHQWLEQHTEDWQKVADSTDGNQRRKFLAEAYIRELAKRRAVWCWFNSQHESAGMWSVYGTAGIAVVTHLAALERSLPQALNFQVARIAYVNRSANSPLDYFDPGALKNQELIHRPHLVKGQEYKHENEIRVTTTCSPDECGRLVTGIGTRDLIGEVVISPLLPLEEANAMEALIKRSECRKRTTPPLIRRSSILGRIAKQQESMAALDKLAEEQGGSPHFEPSLPPPLADL